MIGRLVDLLVRHEGLRLKPYLDCCGKYWRECACEKKGKLTIGVGRNLDDVGIMKNEAMDLLANDIARAHRDAYDAFPFFKYLDPVRQDVIRNMVFNMGVGGVQQFVQMLAAIVAADFKAAAAEMRSSKWSGQVGDRAIELALMMETGKYPN